MSYGKCESPHQRLQPITRRPISQVAFGLLSRGRVTRTFAPLNNANAMRVQKMMRHRHYATTETYMEKVQRLLKGGKDTIMQIQAIGGAPRRLASPDGRIVY